MLDPASKAVFLSYASQDAEAAKHICEALRAGGVEVWLDQSELVGGDAWDAKIRGQIQACALFLPIISANTQARAEGYFRREWKLAAERTHDMADHVAFLVPVVIDGTKDREAHVPEKFRAVQWTKLPGGETSAGFVARVQKLLGGPSAPVATSAPASLQPGAPTHAAQSGLPLWAGLALGVVVLALIGYVVTRPGTMDAVPAAKPVAESKPVAAVPTAPLVNDRSIAVLPFGNLSPDKDNEFFADGIHEDVLTNLQNIRELRVVSRTSVLGYRGTTKKIGEIARELGVTYILEGSVRRAGNTVRVSAQLIDARTDAHLWSPQPYDRDLSATGIFAIQSEIAQSIANALQTRLSPQEKNLIGQRPTENLAAYDLYLKASGEYSETGEALLVAAVKLDPKFALAWARLSRLHGLAYANHVDQSQARLDKAKAAIDKAVELAPDHPEVIHALGRYYYSGFGDFPRALEHYERVARMQPNNSDIWHSIGSTHRRQGRWTEAIADYRKVSQLDPGNFDTPRQLATTLLAGRRYEEAKAEYRRIVTHRPQDLRPAFELARVSFQATGSTKEVEAFFAQLPAPQASSTLGVNLRKSWAAMTGAFPVFHSLDQIKTTGESGGLYRDARSDLHFLTPALVMAAQGDIAAAQASLSDSAKLHSRLEKEPLNPDAWLRLGMVEAMLGHKEEALRCARKAVELAPESRDSFGGAGYGAGLAFVYAWTGDKDRAIAEYARLLRTPAGFQNIHEMKRAPEYAPLRGDPRFQALLNDPKNNAPLF